MADNWNISPEAMLHFIEFVESEQLDIIVELGSGESTHTLRSIVPCLLSIEEDVQFFLPSDGRHRMLWAKIVDGWYDISEVSNFLASNTQSNIDCLLIDGPAHGDRVKIIPLLHTMFNWPKFIAVDDSDRDDSKQIAAALTENNRYDLLWSSGTSVKTFNIYKRNEQ